MAVEIAPISSNSNIWHDNGNLKKHWVGLDKELTSLRYFTGPVPVWFRRSRFVWTPENWTKEYSCEKRAWCSTGLVSKSKWRQKQPTSHHSFDGNLMSFAIVFSHYIALLFLIAWKQGRLSRDVTRSGYFPLDWVTKTTGTSLDDGARNTNTQIWPN